MIQYSISFDLGAKMDAMGAVNAKVFPLVSQAVRTIAKQAAMNWQNEVLKAKLWSVEKDAYAKSIKWEMPGDFTALIESNYKYAKEIETGRPVRDLKKMLDTSAKVRRTTDGRRFLVIPMHHNTPGERGGMPAGVYGMAKAIKATRVTKQSERETGEVVHLHPQYGMSKARGPANFLTAVDSKKAATVAARTYAWGGKLTGAAMKQEGMDAATRKRYAGMVKMNTSTPGGAKSSSHLTFRVMIEGSNKWVIGAQPGLFLVKKVADDLAPKAQSAIVEAVKLTVG